MHKKLALTPPMGWASWNLFRNRINETLIEDIAKAMRDSGLADCGYQYINIDDCWMSSSRDENGRLRGDLATFPSGIKALCEKVNALGLKLGLMLGTECRSNFGPILHTEVLVNLGNLHPQLVGIALAQAADDKQSLDESRLLGRYGRENGVDALLLGVADKSARIDDYYLAIHLVGVVAKGISALFQELHQFLRIHQILRAAEGDEADFCFHKLNSRIGYLLMSAKKPYELFAVAHEIDSNKKADQKVVAYKGNVCKSPQKINHPLCLSFGQVDSENKGDNQEDDDKRNVQPKKLRNKPERAFQLFNKALPRKAS